MRPLMSMNHATSGQSVNIMSNYAEQVFISCFRLETHRSIFDSTENFLRLEYHDDFSRGSERVWTFGQNLEDEDTVLDQSKTELQQFPIKDSQLGRIAIRSSPRKY